MSFAVLYGNGGALWLVEFWVMYSIMRNVVFKVVPNLYEFFSSVQHKRTLVSKQLTVAIDFHSIYFFLTMEVIDYNKLFGYQYSSKYLLLCAKEQRNNNLRESEWRQNVYFRVNYPFKKLILKISWNNVKRWLEQRHVPSINNLKAHSRSVYELSLKITFPIVKMNEFLFLKPDCCTPLKCSGYNSYLSVKGKRSQGRTPMVKRLP